jgi:hypothetical protein
MADQDRACHQFMEAAAAMAAEAAAAIAAAASMNWWQANCSTNGLSPGSAVQRNSFTVMRSRCSSVVRFIPEI